jgi:predicted enzyme related to lactoylglutathione lyase
MPNVTYFEIGADDLEEAAAFYSKVFDWKIQKALDGSDYRYIFCGEDDPGIEGGLCARYDKWNATINTIAVKSINDCAKRIAEGGGKVLAPMISIPGVGDVQYCHDPEGNAFGIMEYYEDDSS